MIDNSDYRQKLSQLDHYQEIISNEFVTKWVERIRNQFKNGKEKFEASHKFQYGTIEIKRFNAFTSRGVQPNSEIQISMKRIIHLPHGCNLHWIAVGLANHFYYNITISDFPEKPRMCQITLTKVDPIDREKNLIFPKPEPNKSKETLLELYTMMVRMEDNS